MPNWPTESASLPQWCHCLWTVIILGLQLTDCSACDHQNHWILDSTTDLAKYSWDEFLKFGGSCAQKVRE